jgi:hypothetical protein
MAIVSVSISDIQVALLMVRKIHRIIFHLFLELRQHFLTFYRPRLLRLEPSKIGDGVCDLEYNTPDCRYDG